MINSLVLHKIVEKEKKSFEDIDIFLFEMILKIISGKTLISNQLNQSNKKKYLLTFDDGNISDIKFVLPLLKKYNCKAVFFIVPSFVGNKGFMNWSHIIELKKNGMEIGSHSQTHQFLTTISKNKQEYELKKSKDILESKLNSEIISFSFPYGSYDKDLVSLTLDIGYKYIYNSDHGLYNGGDLIPRNSINSSTNFNNVKNIIKPNTLIRIKWKFEDLIKSFLKKNIKKNHYYILRKFFSKL